MFVREELRLDGDQFNTVSIHQMHLKLYVGGQSFRSLRRKSKKKLCSRQSKTEFLCHVQE